MLVRGLLSFLGRGGTEFDKQVGNVAVHCEAESMFFVVPGDVYAFIKISFPILGDAVMLLEDITEIMGMSFTHVFDTKFVYN